MTLQGNKLPMQMKEKSKKRISSWLLYGQIKDTGKSFTEITSIHNHLNIIFEIFMKNQIEFFRAPYLAFAQLSWLQNDEKLVQFVYGGHENLLYPMNRLIFSFDFSSGTFDYIDKKDFLASLNISSEKLLDIALLSGCYFNDTFPIHDPNFQNPNTFQKFLDIIIKWDKAQNLLMMTQNFQFQTDYFRSRVLIDHHIVLTSKCSTLIMNLQKCPPFFRDIIGPKLPDDIYFYVSQCVISPFVMNNIITCQLIEQIPALDTNEIRNLSLNVLLPIQTLTINLILPHLSNILQSRKIFFIRWFDQKSIVMNIKPFKLDKFRFKLDDGEIATLLKKDHKSKSDYQFVMSKLTKDEEKKDVEYTKLKEAHAYILLRTLELLGYFDDNFKLNSFGKSISQAKLYSEQTLILLELYRSKFLTSKAFTIPNSFLDLGGNKDIKEEILLISRVLSLIPMSFDKNSWKGPVDSDLISFNCLIGNYYKTLRNLTEMILLDSLLSKKISVSLKKLTEFSIKLPYYQEPNVAMGLVSKTILETSDEEIENKITEIQRIFPNCLNPTKDLKNGINFWNQFMKIIPNLEDKELNEQFQKADSFLQSKISKIKQFL